MYHDGVQERHQTTFVFLYRVFVMLGEVLLLQLLVLPCLRGCDEITAGMVLAVLLDHEKRRCQHEHMSYCIEVRLYMFSRLSSYLQFCYVFMVLCWRPSRLHLGQHPEMMEADQAKSALFTTLTSHFAITDTSTEIQLRAVPDDTARLYWQATPGNNRIMVNQSNQHRFAAKAQLSVQLETGT